MAARAEQREFITHSLTPFNIGFARRIGSDLVDALRRSSGLDIRYIGRSLKGLVSVTENTLDLCLENSPYPFSYPDSTEDGRPRAIVTDPNHLEELLIAQYGVRRLYKSRSDKDPHFISVDRAYQQNRDRAIEMGAQRFRLNDLPVRLVRMAVGSQYIADTRKHGTTQDRIFVLEEVVTAIINTSRELSNSGDKPLDAERLDNENVQPSGQPTSSNRLSGLRDSTHRTAIHSAVRNTMTRYSETAGDAHRALTALNTILFSPRK